MLLIQEDSWIFNFSMAGGWYYLALAMLPPARTEAAGSKNVWGCYTPAVNVAGGWKKCTNLYY
jgi:hypothetical protein